jgi:hypothetical protein
MKIQYLDIRITLGHTLLIELDIKRKLILYIYLTRLEVGLLLL